MKQHLHASSHVQHQRLLRVLLVAIFLKSGGFNSGPFFGIKGAADVYVRKKIGWNGIKSQRGETRTTSHLCSSTMRHHNISSDF